MDDKTLAKARKVCDKFQAEFEKNAREWHKSKYYDKKRYQDELLKAKTQADKHHKLFQDYCDHVLTCTLEYKETAVRRVGGSFWSFEQDRLKIAPIVLCKSKYRKKGYRIQSVDDFAVKRPLWGGGFDNVVPPAGFYYNMLEGFRPLIINECGTRLAELDAELHQIEVTARARASEAIRAFKDQFSGAEQKKFEEGFLKFLRSNQFFSDADPKFMLACLAVDPEALANLYAFLRSNRLAMNFVTEENISSMQDLAKIAEVHDA